MPTDTTRTCAVHLYTEAGTDYRIEIIRETRRAYENEDTKRLHTFRHARQLSAISATTVPGGPVTVTTYADLAALISAAAAALAAEAVAIPATSDP